MGHTAWVGLAAAALVLAGCAGSPVELTPAGPTATGNATALEAESIETVEVTVTAVVDGDTLAVRFPDGSEDTVRLLGVDTPEVAAETQPAEYEGVPDTAAGANCLRSAGEAATAYTRERIAGARVTLGFDPAADRRGGYGRLLAYVYADGGNLNQDLVESGHARLYDTEFGMREAFAATERRAQADGRGLWACRRVTPRGG